MKYMPMEAVVCLVGRDFERGLEDLEGSFYFEESGNTGR
jgi:hypothetical protein